MEALRAALARLCRPEALLEGESYYHNAAEERGGGDGSQLTTFGDHQLRHSNMQKRDPAFHALIDHASVLPFIEEYMGEPQLVGDWHIRKNIGPRSSWCEYSIIHCLTAWSHPLSGPGLLPPLTDPAPLSQGTAATGRRGSCGTPPPARSARATSILRGCLTTKPRERAAW